jgi:hypothetical protein
MQNTDKKYYSKKRACMPIIFVSERKIGSKIILREQKKTQKENAKQEKP